MKYLIVSFSFAVRHVSGPLVKTRHFGHVGGADQSLTFVQRMSVPLTADQSPDHRERLSNVDRRTFRALMTDAAFTTDARVPLEKPAFFFGDRIHDDGRRVSEGTYKWLRQIGDGRLFLPDMERMFPLLYFQHMSIPRKMEWDISQSVPEITLGDFGFQRVNRHDSHDRSTVGLFPASRKSNIPVGEIPQLAATFLNSFIAAEGDYPAEFRLPGWVHSTENSWWGEDQFLKEELPDLFAAAGLSQLWRFRSISKTPLRPSKHLAAEE